TLEPRMLKKILFSTLYPETLGRLREDLNTLEILDGYRRGYSSQYALRFLGASAHAEPLKRMAELLPSVGVEYELCRVPHRHKPEFDERRAHEIAHGKQWLARRWQQMDFDYLLFLDADIWISFADIARCLELIKAPSQFVSFPY